MADRRRDSVHLLLDRLNGARFNLKSINSNFQQNLLLFPSFKRVAGWEQKYQIPKNQ
jgi:hypothetical protein